MPLYDFACSYSKADLFQIHVSLMLCVPIWSNHRIAYLAVPLGYRMWQKKESKLELAAAMVRQVMPSFAERLSIKDSGRSRTEPSA